LGNEREAGYRPTSGWPIENEHKIIARAGWASWPIRWDIERPRSSGLRQDFRADPRVPRLRLQRDILMLPSDQHYAVTRERRGHHFGEVALAVRGIDSQI
jgi:hypothetical protein